MTLHHRDKEKWTAHDFAHDFRPDLEPPQEDDETAEPGKLFIVLFAALGVLLIGLSVMWVF